MKKEIIREKFISKWSKKYREIVKQDFKEFLSMDGSLKKEQVNLEKFQQQGINLFAKVSNAAVVTPLMIQKLAAQQVIQRISNFSISKVGQFAQNSSQLSALVGKSGVSASTRISSLMASGSHFGSSGAKMGGVFVDVAVDAGELGRHIAKSVESVGQTSKYIKMIKWGGSAFAVLAIGLEIKSIIDTVDDKDQKQAISALKQCIQRLEVLNDTLKKDVDMFGEYFKEKVTEKVTK